MSAFLVMKLCKVFKTRVYLMFSYEIFCKYNIFKKIIQRKYNFFFKYDLGNRLIFKLF